MGLPLTRPSRGGPGRWGGVREDWGGGRTRLGTVRPMSGAAWAPEEVGSEVGSEQSQCGWQRRLGGGDSGLSGLRGPAGLIRLWRCPRSCPVRCVPAPCAVTGRGRETQSRPAGHAAGRADPQLSHGAVSLSRLLTWDQHALGVVPFLLQQPRGQCKAPNVRVFHSPLYTCLLTVLSGQVLGTVWRAPSAAETVSLPSVAWQSEVSSPVGFSPQRSFPGTRAGASASAGGQVTGVPVRSRCERVAAWPGRGGTFERTNSLADSGLSPLWDALFFGAVFQRCITVKLSLSRRKHLLY